MTDQPPKLGDAVTIVMRESGVESLVQHVARLRGKPCGCKKRQEALNEFQDRITERIDRIYRRKPKKHEQVP